MYTPASPTCSVVEHAAITQEDLSINQICCSSITRGLHRLTEYDYIAIAGGLLHHYYARQHDRKNWRVIFHITGGRVL